MKARRTSRKSLTDFKRLDELDDKDINFSEVPEIPPSKFARGIVRSGLKPIPPKKQLTLRVDQDVLAWFRAQGRGYHTRINALLRAYMDAHRS